MGPQIPFRKLYTSERLYNLHPRPIYDRVRLLFPEQRAPCHILSSACPQLNLCFRNQEQLPCQQLLCDLKHLLFPELRTPCHILSSAYPQLNLCSRNQEQPPCQQPLYDRVRLCNHQHMHNHSQRMCMLYILLLHTLEQ